MDVTDRVRVWIVPVDVSPDTVASCWDALDDGERARAGAFRGALGRQRFTIAHGTLRILAARELQTRPAALTWITGRHGKPELAPPWSGLHTSLSHSANMIAVALSRRRAVGIDIQHLVPGLDAVGLSARFFPPEEAGYVAAGGDANVRADRFAYLWARKEAVVKAAGSRIGPNLGIAVRNRQIVNCTQPVSAHRVADVGAPPSYRAAVALTGEAPFVIEAVSWPNTVAAPTVN
ncbi:MAG: 4'-phosphopantetheinyl transferase family protein [Micromonosporaceae bacterium]